MRSVRRISDHFARRAKRAAAKSLEERQLLDLVIRSMKSKDGVVLGEKPGRYNAPYFMKKHMKRLRKEGADILFVDMFTQDEQKFLDEWAVSGDPSNLIDHINKSKSAYSEYMWQFYFDMLAEAMKHKIRVVAITPELRDRYSGIDDLGMNILKERKIHNVLSADTEERSKSKARKTKANYVIYCHRRSVYPTPSGRGSISAMRNITGYVLENGLAAFAGSSKPSLNPHILYLPKFSQQHTIYAKAVSFAKPVRAHSYIEYPDYKNTVPHLKK